MFRRNLLAAAAGLALPLTAYAQTWPARSVRVIIPYPPGGGTDIGGRLVCQKLAEHWGQPVVVDNRGGAGGMIGTRAAGQAAPDGYTLLFNGTASVVRDNFDPLSVVDHVVRTIITHNVLVVNPTVPVTSVPEFIAYAKANPGRLNHGTSGALASQHLAAVMFDLMAGTRIENVHYRGTGPSVAGILANEVQLMFGSMSAVLPLIQDGRVRALATASGRKSLQMPQLPTIGEFIPGYAAELTYSFCTPLNTPEPVKRRLEESVKAVLEAPGVATELQTRGFEPNFEIGASLASAIDEDMKRWADILQRAGINLNEQ